MRIAAFLAVFWAAALTAGEGKVNPADGLRYVWIPPGTFLMGGSPGDDECDGDEKPAHTVTISKGFGMRQTEVTVSAHKRFASRGGGSLPSGNGSDDQPVVNCPRGHGGSALRQPGRRRVAPR